MDKKRLTSIALSVILVTSTFTIFSAFTFFPIQQADAQGLQIRVSGAERPQFQNHFFGPQIQQIILDDPGATDPDESTVGLVINGFTAARVHLSDGLWYAYVAEDESFGLLLDVITDGIRDNRIAIADTTNDDGATSIIGGTTYNIDTGVINSFVKEIETDSGGFVHVEVVGNRIFSTIPAPFFEDITTTTNPDLRIGAVTEGNGVCTSAGGGLASFSNGIYNAGDADCDWPHIRLIGLEELDTMEVRAGGASVIMIYDDLAESVASSVDRTAAYPVNAEVIVQFTDFMFNINPVEEDGQFFVLNRATGSPDFLIYRILPPGHGFDADILPVLFRPNLNFDTRQILELDREGMQTIRFIHAYSVSLGALVSFAPEPFTRISENARLVAEFDDAAAAGDVFFLGTATSTGPLPAGDLLPAVRMFETDPNTNVMISTVEPLGGRSVLFTGFNDRVANFDYFDIINSVAMTFHDGFTTVDREVYDSADRAVFTVTDPDQNLRSRISEQPSAVESNSFVKVGDPFPLGNNPTFANFFGKQTVNFQDGPVFNYASAGVSDADGTFDRVKNEVGNELSPIRAASLFLALDPDDPAFATEAAIEAELNLGSAFGVADVTIAGDGGVRINRVNPDSQVVALDLNKDGDVDKNGNANTGEVIMIAFETNDDATTDIRDAEPFDPARDGQSQKIGLDFRTGTIGGDKASAIIVNSNVNLADLNKFQIFTATGDQIILNTEDTKPVGQAFAVDPAIMATGLFTTPATSTTPTAFVTQGGVVPGTVYRVMAPEYNFIRATMEQLQTGTEAGTDDRLRNIAIQIEAICPTDVCPPDGKIVRQLVDFGPLDAADTDNIAGGLVNLLGSTKLGTGSFRVVDFLTANWDGDASAWPVDATEADLFDDIKLTFTVVTIGQNTGDHANEPSELIDASAHIVGLDIDGIVTVIPPPVVPGGTSTFPAQRTIDEVTLVAREHAVFRIQVKEQGSNSSIFTGRMDFLTSNQLDTVQTALIEIVFQGDPAKALMPNRFIPPTRLAFAYTDIDIVEVFRPTSASFIYETRDGSIEWDRSSYSFGQDAFVTMIDEDLNRRPDATERFNVNVAGFIFLELGKQRVLTETLNSVAPDFFANVDATFLETGPNTGTYVAQITMPRAITVSTAAGGDNIQGTADDTAGSVNTQQEDLEINYIDVRDRSSIRQEFDSIANIRTTLGDVVLDRAAYPPGAIMFVEIHDNDFNTDVDIRENIDLRQLVAPADITAGAFTGTDEGATFLFNDPRVIAAADGGSFDAADLATDNDFAQGAEAPGKLAPILEITIFQTGVGKLVTLLPVGITTAAGTPAAANLDDRFGEGIAVGTGQTLAVLPILDRNGNPVTQAIETGPNTGIFEFETQLPGPAQEARFPFDLPDILTTGTLTSPVITSNQPIEVIYFDNSDESGEAEDEEELATFLTNTARLRTDKLEYGLGDRVEIIIEEPDFNRDSRSVDQVDFSILDIVTDKVDTEFGARADQQNFGTVVNDIPQLRTNLTQFRESNFNSGVFTVAIEEIIRDLVDRGETVRLLYFDRTPSGGGSEIRVQYTFLVVAILPEIVFDKEEYTPFDEVIVSIISPDSNNDPDRIETITPLISSSSESLGRRSFPETGPSTGIFEEDFDLSPDKTRFPGDLRAVREDGVTVEFRIDSDTVATKSVFVNYHVGQVMFDKDAFRIDERGVLRVIDPDANTNPDTIDTLDVRFWSTTDRGGLLVVLRETGDRTGIFEEIITFTPDEESSGTRLRVAEGDTITAKYTDNTLPAPAALDADETFTVEVEELFASGLIGSAVPALERAVASEPVLVDQTGAEITDVTVGSQVLIQSTITNSQTKKQPFAYIVQIKDKDGVTESLSWVTGELPAKESLAAAQSWIPGAAGEFSIEVFVWESVDNPTALSPVREKTVTVRL
jgi:hypothetical protein